MKPQVQRGSVRKGCGAMSLQNRRTEHWRNTRNLRDKYCTFRPALNKIWGNLVNTGQKVSDGIWQVLHSRARAHFWLATKTYHILQHCPVVFNRTRSISSPFPPCLMIWLCVWAGLGKPWAVVNANLLGENGKAQLPGQMKGHYAHSSGVRADSESEGRAFCPFN